MCSNAVNTYTFAGSQLWMYVRQAGGKQFLSFFRLAKLFCTNGTLNAKK